MFEGLQVVGEVGGQDDRVVVQDAAARGLPHPGLQLTRQVQAAQTHQKGGDVFVLGWRNGLPLCESVSVCISLSPSC